MNSAGGRARRAGLLAGVFLLQFLFYLFLASRRLIDSDEGFYLFIPKLMMTKGMVLYRDVFYQQMPLLPFLYGGWMKLFGFSWEAGRAFSAFLSALMGALLFGAVWRRSARLSLASAALLLYAFNLSALLFFLTAKTYALSTALLFGGMLAGVDAEGKPWRHWLCGALLAFSVQTRLFFAAAVPVLGLWLWLGAESRKSFLRFAAGFLVGMLPTLNFLAIAPRQFIYDNILYHGMRDPAGLVGDLAQKLNVARKLFIGPGTVRPTQFTLLFPGVVLACALWKKVGGLGLMSATLALALGAASLLPTPTFGQYFCVLVPFMIIALAESVRAMGAMSGRLREALPIAFLCFSLVYAGWATSRVDALFVRGEEVPGKDPGTEPSDWKPETVRRIAGIIESNTDSDALVVSSWPGYLLETERGIYPKMENQISLDTSRKLSVEEADLFRMLREEELVEAIGDARVQMVVAGNAAHGRRHLYRETARENGYELLERVGGAEIYVRRSERPESN
jgi:hypothetical protein